MPSKPKSISDWQELAHASPERAARALLDSIASIPQSTRDRVFAAVPTLPAITAHFAESCQTPSNPLSGVPFLLKDLYDFPGYPTTASSSFLAELRPEPSSESALSASLREAGAVFAGKTHLNEFAYGLSGENLTFGDCPHPVFPERVSGGSSSGSAWAVRSGIVPVATGTDTGGSIRVPAAWCGLFGLRLSPNEWSSKGCFPLAPSFDTAGWFTATAADMAKVIKTLIPTDSERRSKARGISLIDAVPNLPDEFRNRCTDTLERLNVTKEASANASYLDSTRNVASHYAVLQSIDAFNVHKSWLDSHKCRYDPVVWQRLDRGRNWTEDQINAACRGEAATRSFFDTCFKEYDFIVLPATQSPAISAKQHTDAFRNELLAITAPGSFARCPVLTIPIPLKNGESMGLQILYENEKSDLPLRLIERLAE